MKVQRKLCSIQLTKISVNQNGVKFLSMGCCGHSGKCPNIERHVLEICFNNQLCKVEEAICFSFKH